MDEQLYSLLHEMRNDITDIKVSHAELNAKTATTLATLAEAVHELKENDREHERRQWIHSAVIVPLTLALGSLGRYVRFLP